MSNKLTSINSFEGGMVTDLHNLSVPANVTVDALNIELITVGDNQYILQNIRGNKKILEFPKHSVDGNEYDFIPLGMKVNNNIAYILVGAFDDNGEFITGGIGTFPSPKWSVLNNSLETKTELEYSFRFLHNLKNEISKKYDAPFISQNFNFIKNKHIEMELQVEYDSSTNIIFTDAVNNTLIINSRFKKIDSSNFVSLAKRDGKKESNVYSNDDWDRISLIQNSNFPVKIYREDGETLGISVNTGGYLRGGGYRYYLKYTTPERNETEIIYESPLIPISNGSLGLKKDQISNKLVRFIVKNLDSSYSGIQVFFAHYSGTDSVEVETFKIDYIFSYADVEELVITHSGVESVTPVDSSEISSSFTPIDTVQSTTIINDRLALAGVSSTLSQEDINILKEASKKITLWEKEKPVYKPYSDPETAANNMGYWKGEVYEFAAVFMLTNKGLSPAFPLTGMDNFAGLQATFVNGEYPEYDNFIDETGFAPGSLINNKGVFRTNNDKKIYTPTSDGKGVRHITYLEAKVNELFLNSSLKKIASGFFIVRRVRLKNVLMQGMAVPTLKLPAKRPSSYTGSLDGQATMSAAKRYLMFHFDTGFESGQDADFPTLGLNAPYKAVVDSDKTFGTDYFGTGQISPGSPPYFNDDFSIVFVPQPTQTLNVLTNEKALLISGGISQVISSSLNRYSNTIEKDGEVTDNVHMAFYSCEIDLNLPAVKDHINGIDPAIEVQWPLNSSSPVGCAYVGKDVKSESNAIVYIAEPIDVSKARWSIIPSEGVKAYILDSGISTYTNKGFSSKTDRSLGLVSDKDYWGDFNNSEGDNTSFYSLPYRRDINSRAEFELTDINVIASNSKAEMHPNTNKYLFNRFFPYSIISQSYSSYIGLKVDTTKVSSYLPKFHFLPKIISDKNDLPNKNIVLDNIDSAGKIEDRVYLNTGQLANMFRSSVGRWTQDKLIDIYKYDSNKPYYAVTSRYSLSEDIDKIDIFRGDCFISRIFKRTSYKNGVPSSKSATTADASDYGLGIAEIKSNNVSIEDIPASELDDKGRNLFDVGQIIEIVSQSNINADIRNVEEVSKEDTALYGGKRNFFPNKEDLFSDARPDSTAYNHGYTGEDTLIPYFRIEESSPSFSTEFPNRVLISAKNKTQSFFNSFRNIKGFNFRDYGVEFGPIIKIVSFKSALLTIHTSGVLAIGVDDKTLVAGATDVYINTAEALSPDSTEISTIYGSIHPESVVKTNRTIIGVDYNANVIWQFEGNKLNPISKLTITTLLTSYKNKIINKSFEGAIENNIYVSRVYSSYDYTKDVVQITYIAEDKETKEQFFIGSVTYSTILEKFISTMSEGNKFSMFINSNTYTSGFQSNLGNKDIAIWKEDALKDESGKIIRNRIRGVDYNYYFEIVINKETSLEKILDNLKLICNKSIPLHVTYTTNGDENDAAVNVWGPSQEENILEQKLITRNKSTGNNFRLGILDENVYYKNSGLYIEVGKTGSISRKEVGLKRIRDKAIKVKFTYTGNDETFVQAVISVLSISHS